MARKNSKQSPLDIILASTWKVPAFFALFVALVLFVLVPEVKSPAIASIGTSLRLFGLIAIGVLVLISLFKLYFQMRSAKTKKKFAQFNLDPDTDSPFARTTLFDFLQRPSRWSLKVIQDIEWKRFEDLSAAYYLEKGILAKTTSLGVDGGIDIKLFQDETGDATSLVQCKAWNSRKVGVKQVRAFLEVLTHENIPKGFLMISGEFSNEAKAVAKANKVNLITGEMFLSMIMRLPEDSQKKLLELAIAGDYKTPSCPACGVKMDRREAERGAVWECVNYPKCRQKINIRKPSSK